MKSIQEIHKMVFEKFTWTSDQIVFESMEHWKSFATEVLEGKSFKGDCDDFALTCCELLMKEGYDRQKLKIATCYTETNEYHAVCLCDDYCLDNRFNEPMRIDSIGYRWHKYMSMDSVGVWYKYTQ